MNSEILVMTCIHGPHMRCFSPTFRNSLIGSLLQELIFFEVVEYIQRSIESNSFHGLARQEIIDLEYDNGVLRLACFPHEPEACSIPISELLLYRICMLWHKILVSPKKYPYIRLDIDWDNDIVTLTELDTWTGPNDIIVGDLARVL